MRGFDACVFCGATPTNNEDVIPRWLVRFLRVIPPATRRMGRSFADRTDLGSAKAQAIAGIGVGKVKAVCKDTCNNGWMKRLEDRAKPILQPMMKDTPLQLDRDAQATLATWAYKTAIMLTVKYSKVPSTRLRTDLYEHGRPPPTSVVWLSHVDPEKIRLGTGPLLSVLKSDLSVREEGFIARLNFANVGFVVFGNPAPPDGMMLFIANVLRDSFRPIWPIEDEQLAWPLGQSVTANEIDAFAQRLRHAITAGQPLPSAPAHHVFTFDEGERASDEIAVPPSNG